MTMTLPDRILTQLAGIDPDRTRAVVKATEAVAGTGRGRFQPVELIEMAPGKSLIVVGPNTVLKKIPWLKMIEIAKARHLLMVPSGTPIEALEVALGDLLHDPAAVESDRDNAVLHELVNIISQKRRTKRLSKAEILIIDSR
ncbi:MAG: hypothetical protein NTZ26_11450 [Candidatus Aminicenantes bacterium]|nr:hypothetical protein [Candidatus Aminicenantes bacterium]